MQFKEGMRVHIVNHAAGANFKKEVTWNHVYSRDLPPNTVYIIREVQENYPDNPWPILLDAPPGHILTGCSYVSPKHLVPVIKPRLTRRHT
jgi:hypothetical protein